MPCLKRDKNQYNIFPDLNSQGYRIPASLGLSWSNSKLSTAFNGICSLQASNSNLQSTGCGLLYQPLRGHNKIKSKPRTTYQPGLFVIVWVTYTEYESALCRLCSAEQTDLVLIPYPKICTPPPSYFPPLLPARHARPQPPGGEKLNTTFSSTSHPPPD